MKVPRRAAALAAASLLAFCSALVANTPRTAAAPPDEAARDAAADAAEHAARRKRLADAAGPGAVVVVLRPADLAAAPRSGRCPDYEYLSPVPTPGAAVVVASPRAAKDAAADRNGTPVQTGTPAQNGNPAQDGNPAQNGTPAQNGNPAADAAGADDLFLPARNAAMERWTGPEAEPGEATAAAAGFRACYASGTLAQRVAKLLEGRDTLLVTAGPGAAGDEAVKRFVALLRDECPGRWVRFADGPLATRDDQEAALRKALPKDAQGAALAEAVRKLSVVEVRTARALVGALREVKSRREIERIRRAVAASCDGIRGAIAAAEPGVAEYELAGWMEFRCRSAGCAFQAYPSIVGSGPNSCVLHYERNRRVLAAGDMIVMDAGGEYEGYAADVTRSFPASGRFTAEQARVYDAVLEAQEAALVVVKPGATLGDVHKAAVDVLERHGLRRWFIHGTSHSVGLEVHDPWGRDAKLRPGVVLTVEPGVYRAEDALGVRIEDTVVVTESGHENLSAGLPKTREAIETLMREPAPAGFRAR